MNKSVRKADISLARRIMFAVFILAETGIYIAFNVMAALGFPDPIYLKYSGVLLCLLFSVCTLFFVGGKDSIFVACALAFTAVSDWFILVRNDNYEIGLITFIIVQCIYFARLYFKRYKKILPTIIARAVLIAALFAVFGTCFNMTLLVAECIIYVSMLVGNVIDAFVLCKRGVKDTLFAVGLLLFLCCDICVGLHNFGSVLNVSLPDRLLSFASVAIWAFYLPSQVLIVCSVKSFDKKA